MRFDFENEKYGALKENNLYRIYAKKDFSNVAKGDKGGLIEREHNLSQYGNCWIYEKAKAVMNSEVFDNATVFDKAEIFGNAKVFENAKIFDNAKIFGNSRVYGNAKVFNNAIIYYNAMLYGDANAYNNTEITTKLTKKAFNLNYDTYNITGMDNHLKIGCKCYTYKEWWNFTDEEILKMDGKNALKWWKKWKPILMSIFDYKELK